jgi:hypothetical protein
MVRGALVIEAGCRHSQNYYPVMQFKTTQPCTRANRGRPARPARAPRRCSAARWSPAVVRARRVRVRCRPSGSGPVRASGSGPGSPSPSHLGGIWPGRRADVRGPHARRPLGRSDRVGRYAAARHAHDPADRAGGPARRAVSRSPGRRTRHPDPGRWRRGQPLRPRGGEGAGGVGNYIVTAPAHPQPAPSSCCRSFGEATGCTSGSAGPCTSRRSSGPGPRRSGPRSRWLGSRRTRSSDPRDDHAVDLRRARGPRRRQLVGRGVRQPRAPDREDRRAGPDRSLLTAHDGVVATRLRGRTEVTRRPQCSIVRRTRSSGAGGTAYRRSPNSLTAPSGASLSM